MAGLDYLRRHAFGLRIAIDVIALAAGVATLLWVEDWLVSASLLATVILGGEAISEMVYRLLVK